MNPLSRNRHSPSLAGHGGGLFDEIEGVDLRLLCLVGWWNGWMLFLAVAFLEVLMILLGVRFSAVGSKSWRGTRDGMGRTGIT